MVPDLTSILIESSKAISACAGWSSQKGTCLLLGLSQLSKLGRSALFGRRKESRSAQESPTDVPSSGLTSSPQERTCTPLGNSVLTLCNLPARTPAPEIRLRLKNEDELKIETLQFRIIYRAK